MIKKKRWENIMPLKNVRPKKALPKKRRKIIARFKAKDTIRFSFTNYLSQSILTSIIFYGFGLFGKLQRYQIYYVVGSIWLFQIILSNIWLQYFRFGPFEWVWRSLTYMKKQPMKKHVVVETPEDE